jgi:cell division protein FtsB
MKSNEKSEKSWLLKALIFCGIIIFGLVSYAIFGEFQKKQKIESEINALKSEAERLSQKNSELLERITYFESRDFKEKEAKDKLNLQDPSESLVLIKPSPSKEMNEIDQNQKIAFNKTENTNQNLSNPQKWWNYFFKY